MEPMNNDELRDMFAAAALHGFDLTTLPGRTEVDAQGASRRDQAIWNVSLAAYEVARDMLRVREMEIRQAAKAADAASGICQRA